MAKLRKGATQQHRNIAVATTLGEDVLVLRRMRGQESLGRLFEYRLELLSSDPDIDLATPLGTNATVRCEHPDGGTRHFNGFITDFHYRGEHGHYAAYEATLRPWFWFLTRTSDCRIFQKKRVPDIITTLFREHGFTDYEEALNSNYREWDYCVQYRETDFDFLSRLMEQEGIYYYFKHENGKHRLVLSDGYSSHQTFPGYAEMTCSPSSRAIHKEHIGYLDASKQVLPGVVALNDFNFVKPRADLKASAPLRRPHEKADFEIYDYPGEYEEQSDGEAYARKRIEEWHASYEISHGQGNVTGIATGYFFALKDHPRQPQNREHLVTYTDITMVAEAFESGDDGVDAGEQYFKVDFTTIDARESYRSARSTPRPIIAGPQTATVVGRAGEEIWTDKYGRVKVQFHWDRYGKADENSSCWIRVSQAWAGKTWGGMSLPRIGQEVIVEFLEGDPDRPIITGRVYNDENMPPYGLPDHQTRTTLKTNSSKGGDGFNEIRFEDKKGDEQIFIHAEKDEDIRIEHDAREWIGHERHLIVKQKLFEQVEGERHLIVKSGDGGSGDQFESVDGDKHQKVKGDQNQKIGGTRSVDVGAHQQEKVGQRHALDAGTEIHLKAGMKVVIEAGTELTIKVGGQFVRLDSSGVCIQGTTVRINSGGMAGRGTGSRPDRPTMPTAPKEADKDVSGQVSESRASPKQPSGRSLDSTTVGGYQNPQAATLKAAAISGAPFCEICG